MRRMFAAFCVLLLLCLCGCRTNIGGDVFAFPLAAEPICLDPQTANDEPSLAVISHLFEGLTARDGNGKVVPAAAEWSVSTDGLTYVFSLRAATWSNGEAVTSDDFLFAYERAKSLGFPAVSSAVLQEIASITTPNDRTLHITLLRQNDGFLAALADGALYPCPRTFFESCGGGYGMEPSALLQNGPFLLTSWQHDQTLTLRKNTGYRAADEILPAVVRYAVGAASTDDLAAVDTPPVGATVFELADTLQYLWFNATVQPLGSAAVRRALRDAVEWSAVQTTAPTASFVPPAAQLQDSDYVSPLTQNQCNPNRAAFSAAVAATGLSACPTLTLLCEDTAEETALARLVVQSWQKHLSVYFSIEPLPAATLEARLAAGNYHLALAPATARGASPADALFLFGGDQENLSRWQDAAWYAAVSVARSPAELQTLERQLYDACPAAPVKIVTRRFALGKGISGVNVAPFTARVDFRRAVRQKR